ncbi:MAG: hypothetical protein ACXWK9_05210 [Myxococcaceae bacterium]
MVEPLPRIRAEHPLRLVLLAVILLALTVLHPGLTLAAAVVIYLFQGRRRRPVVPRASVVRHAVLPTRAEVLAARFTRLG